MSTSEKVDFENQRAMLPCKTLACLLHSLVMLLSSQPTLCFAHELPFSVSNADQPTSFSTEALNILIRRTPGKKFPIKCFKDIINNYADNIYGTRMKLILVPLFFQNQNFKLIDFSEQTQNMFTVITRGYYYVLDII